MDNCYVYRHIRLDTNRVFYIGIGTKKKNFFKCDEYARSKHRLTKNQYWYNIVNKTDYKVEIVLENLSRSEACEKEREFIKLYGRKDKGLGTLSNMTDGGEGAKGRTKPDHLKKKKKEPKKLRKVYEYTLQGDLVKVWDYAKLVGEFYEITNIWDTLKYNCVYRKLQIFFSYNKYEKVEVLSHLKKSKKRNKL